MSPSGKHSRAIGEAATDAARARVLVTGASGFLGAHLMARLNKTDYDVVTVSGRDVTAETVAATAPDVVIHLAAMTSPDACQKDPGQAREVNVELTRRLANGAKESCRRFLYASTDLVFDGDAGPYAEGDEAHPLCVYGETKLEGESVAREVLGERSTAVRLALLYGVRAEPGGRPSFAETMIGKACAGESVPLYEDQFRTPLLVEDAAASLERLIALPFPEPIELLHLGGPERCSRFEMGRTAFDVLGIPIELARANRMSDHRTVAPRPKDVSLDCARARWLGLFARGLREGFQTFRDRMEEP